jgi:glycosyltransferase involved in cell wall biosynthesis
VVLDLHEAMPEFFTSRFPRASNPLTRAMLRWQERRSIAFADVTLSVNEAMHDRLVGLGVSPDRLRIVRNSPALARFDPSVSPHRSFAADGAIRLVYAGALTPTYELDVVIDAVSRLTDERPDLDLRLELYGRGDSEPILRTMVAELGLSGRVTFHGRVPLEAVPAALAATDIGLAPTRLDGFTALSLSTKVFEYAAMGKPVIASRLPMVERAFPPRTVGTYVAGDAGSLARAIAAVADDPVTRARSVTAAMEVVRRSSWEVEATGYLSLIETLAGTPGRTDEASGDAEAPIEIEVAPAVR